MKAYQAFETFRQAEMRRLFPLFLIAALACVFAGDTAAAGDAPKHKVTQSPSFVSIEPMYATIIDEERPCGMLLVEIGLDIPNETLRANATQALPILRDYYIRSLTSFSASTVRPWQQPDVNLIAERLQRITDKALRQKGARVLLAQVAMHITK